MAEVFFSFREDVDVTRQEHLLEHIRRWPDVLQTTRFAGAEADPDLLRICTAYLAEDAAATAVVRRLLQLPEIEEAEAPAARALL